MHIWSQKYHIYYFMMASEVIAAVIDLKIELSDLNYIFHIITCHLVF